MATRINPAKGPKTDKLWRDAIHRAVKRTLADGKTRRLELLADRLVEAALGGDVTAMKEIGDRLDGRPVASVEHSGTVTQRTEVVFDTASWLSELVAGAARESVPGSLPN